MSTVEAWAWWYLDHVALLLIPAALFDVACWVAIALIVAHKRKAHRA